MKIKRIATLLLAVCLLLSMGIVPAWALEVGEAESYGFDYATKMGYESYQKWSKRIVKLTGLYDAGTINSTAYAYQAVNEPTFQLNHLYCKASVGEWVAVKFMSPETAGTYSMTVTGLQNTYNAQACDIYILPGTTEVGAINNALTANTFVSTIDLNPNDPNLESGDLFNLSADEIEVEASTEYIVVFKPTKNAQGDDSAIVSGNNYTIAGIRVAGISLTLNAAASGTVDMTDVINKATEGEIKLESDATVGDIKLNEGVTLDLNGHTLTASSVIAVNGSNVIDSSANATGLLKVAADQVSLSSDNAQLPLYDSANEGFRFYTATLKTWEPEGNAYWFRLTFSNSSAYDLIARGDSGLKIGVKMTWDGIDEAVFAHPDASFYTGWANAVKGDATVAIKVTVNGTENVSNFALDPIYSGLN